MTDEEFFETVLAAYRRLPNAEGVNLGGTRARGASARTEIGISPSTTGERSTFAHSRNWDGRGRCSALSSQLGALTRGI